jgi:hypothetical protein
MIGVNIAANVVEFILTNLIGQKITLALDKRGERLALFLLYMRP